VQENIDQWRNTVIQAHYAYVDPYKKAVDLVIPWNRQNDAVVTACSGAIINLLEKRK
jgi:uridine kinase